MSVWLGMTSFGTEVIQYPVLFQAPARGSREYSRRRPLSQILNRIEPSGAGPSTRETSRTSWLWRKGTCPAVCRNRWSCEGAPGGRSSYDGRNFFVQLTGACPRGKASFVARSATEVTEIRRGCSGFL